jgi:hypothetical protein
VAFECQDPTKLVHNFKVQADLVLVLEPKHHFVLEVVNAVARLVCLSWIKVPFQQLLGMSVVQRLLLGQVPIVLV